MARKNQTLAQYQTYLARIGWPISADGFHGPRTTEAIQDFQIGFAYCTVPLRASGRLTWRTKKWIKWSAEHEGRCSKNFKFREFASKGNSWIKVKRALVKGLERYRVRLSPRGVAVVSGYRDPAHNARVGGAKSSQHMYGNACDLNPGETLEAVKKLGVFSGIGFQGSGPLKGLVRHVDVRHTGPNNTTGGKPGSPTIWEY